MPAVCTEPNPVFAVGSGRVQTMPTRAFRVFEGRAHNGPRGLYAGLKSPADDPRTALLLASIEDRSRATVAADDLGQTLLVAKHPPQVRLELAEGAAPDRERYSPDAIHKDGLTLFLLELKKPVMTASVLQSGVDESKRRTSVSSVSVDIPRGCVMYLDLSAD